METETSSAASKKKVVSKNKLPQKKNYKLSDKHRLAREIARYKKEYDDYYKNPEKIFDKKTKTWKIVHLKEGYLSKVEGAIKKILSFKATLYTWKC